MPVAKPSAMAVGPALLPKYLARASRAGQPCLLLCCPCGDPDNKWVYSDSLAGSDRFTANAYPRVLLRVLPGNQTLHQVSVRPSAHPG